MYFLNISLPQKKKFTKTTMNLSAIRKQPLNSIHTEILTFFSQPNMTVDCGVLTTPKKSHLFAVPKTTFVILVQITHVFIFIMTHGQTGCISRFYFTLVQTEHACQRFWILVEPGPVYLFWISCKPDLCLHIFFNLIRTRPLSAFLNLV